MADFKKYCDEIHDELDYFARWLPIDEPVQVGDYGTMEGKKFNPIGNFRDLGITITTDDDDGTNDSISYMSSKGVAFSTKVGAGIKGVADGSVTIKFSKQDSLVLIADDLTFQTMNNITKLGDKIKDLKKDNRWKDSYVFVSKRVVSRRFFVAIADSESCSVSLTGSVSKVVSGVADINLSSFVGSSSSSATKFDHTDGTVKTPLFELYQWKNPIIGSPPYVTPYK